MTNYRTLARSPKTTNLPGLAGYVGRKYVLGEPINAALTCGARITVIKARPDEGLLLCANHDGQSLFRIAPQHLEAMATEETDEERDEWLRFVFPEEF